MSKNEKSTATPTEQEEGLLPFSGENTGLMVTDDGIAGQLLSRSASFCSIAVKSRADQAAIYNAMANPDERIAKMINKQIAIKDVYAETVEITNEATGEINSVPRVVLIDADGKSYAAASTGIFNAVKRLFQTFGAPTWSPPVVVEIQQIDRGVDKKILTLKVVG